MDYFTFYNMCSESNPICLSLYTTKETQQREAEARAAPVIADW